MISPLYRCKYSYSDRVQNQTASKWQNQGMHLNVPVSKACSFTTYLWRLSECVDTCCHFLGSLILPDVYWKAFCATSALLVLPCCYISTDFWFLAGCIAQVTGLRTWKSAFTRRGKNRSSLKRPLWMGPWENRSHRNQGTTAMQMWENQPWSLSTVTWVACKLPWPRPKIWMRASELRWSDRLRACPKPGRVYWYLSRRKELLKISWLNLNLQKYCIFSQLVRVRFCFSTIIMSLLCFLLDSQSSGMVVISTLCHYCLLMYVSRPLNDSRLIEERVFLSCYPCVPRGLWDLIQSQFLTFKEDPIW